MRGDPMATLREPRARRACSALAALALPVLLAGCAEEEIPIVTISHPTLVQVSPAEFLGSVPCANAEGAMRRYVATVFDLGRAPLEGAEGGASGEEAEPFALPSSTVDHGGDKATPIPCAQNVGFSRIVDGHRYYAEIDGYDRDDLIALAPGTSILYDPVTSERVDPRWTTTCAAKNPVIGIAGAVRVIGSCEPLEDASPRTETLVRVSVDGALDGLECGDGEGAVERFEVVGSSGASESAACGETLEFDAADITSSTVTLALHAFEAGASDPKWGTTCTAPVLRGVTTTAACLPLVGDGVLEVDPSEALAALGLTCDESAFVELTIELPDAEGNPDPRYVVPANCDRPVQFAERPAGAGTARAIALLPDGSQTDEAQCTATVIPGDTVRATCAGAL